MRSPLAAHRVAIGRGRMESLRALCQAARPIGYPLV